MKIVSIALALFAFVAGLIAAYYWRKSSNVLIVPAYLTPTGIASPDFDRPEVWLPAIINTFQKAGRFNDIAARWTAAAVTLGAAASVVGEF
jgi:hypothetical protein